MRKRLSKSLQSKWSLKKPLYLEKTDKRYDRHCKQLKTNGFSDAETWCLDGVVSEFILPRLIRFKELNNGYPAYLTPEKWDAMLDEMIFAFDWSLNCEEPKYEKLSQEEQDTNWKRHVEGLKMFAENYRQLWW